MSFPANNVRRISATAQYAIAVLSTIGVSFLSYVFAGNAGYQTVSLILLFTVAILSLALSVGPVLVSATLSAMIWNFFFIPPHFTFAITQPQDALMFATYFVISAITGILTTRIRTREKHATALYELTKDLVRVTTADGVVASAVKAVAAMFDAESVVFLGSVDGELSAEPHPSSTFVSDDKEFSVVSWVYWNEKKAGMDVDILPFARCTYYPISGPRYPLGVIGLRRRNKRPLNAEQEMVMQNFIAQIASALEREQLNELTKRTIVYAESEKLYRTLFNSISHELRTPIAAIIGASESLQQQHHSEFTGEIQTAAERLNRLVENLLDMSRLESGQLAPKFDWCDMNDLFRASVQKLKTELSGHAVTISVQNEMPLVKLDFVLMEQVLTNLLYNASIYTQADSSITLAASMIQQHCVITVSDNGPGIPAASLGSLFQKFYRVPGSRTGGTGLGLSIVKGFVEAHKGTISIRNVTPNGTEFTISIPTETHSHNE